jgi:hypothetical protein
MLQQRRSAMGVLGLAAALTALAHVGCAQYMVIRQDGPLDRSVLVAGVERSRIVGTLGRPFWSPTLISYERQGGGRMTDTYMYTDGGDRNRVGWKALRVVLYTAGDVITILLSQILWIPIELAFHGTDYTAVVKYEWRESDQKWTVRSVQEFER